MRIAFLTIMVAFFSGKCFSQDLVIGFFPGSTISLGTGVEATTLENKGTALKPFESEWVDGGIRNFSQQVIITSSADDALEQLSFDLGSAIKGSYDDFSFNGKYKNEFLKYFTQSNSCIHVIFIAEIDWGRKRIKNPQLTNQSKELGLSNIGNFRNQYGTHYVYQENRKTLVFQIYTISKLSLEESTKTLTEIGVDGRYKKIDGSLSTNQVETIRKILKRENITLKSGGFGVDRLPSFSMADDIVAVINGLKDSINGLGIGARESSVATSYTSKKYLDLGLEIPAIPPAYKQIYYRLARIHIRLVAQKTDIENQIAQIGSVLNSGNYNNLGNYLRGALSHVLEQLETVDVALVKIRKGEDFLMPQEPYLIASVLDPLGEKNLTMVDDINSRQIRLRFDGSLQIPFDSYDIKLYRVKRNNTELIEQLTFDSRRTPNLFAKDSTGLRFTFTADVLKPEDIDEIKCYRLEILGPNDLKSVYIISNPF